MVSLPDHGGGLVGRPPVDPQTVKMLGLLACCSERWQDVYLELFIYPRDFFSIFPASFPLLRSITLSSARASRSLGSSNVRVPWDVPLLRAISINRHIMNYLDLPLGQVTYFSLISNAEPGECLDALRLLSCLESCVFTCVTSRLRPATHAAVTSRSLKSFGVEFNPIRASLALPALLDHLTCPSLQALCLCIGPAGIFAHASLTSFLLRSACPLTRLSFSGIKLTSAELVQCLAAVPSLTDLELEKMELPDNTLDDLDLSSHPSPALLPSLQSFSYKGPSQLDFPALMAMVSSRQPSGTDRGDEVGGRVARLKSILVDVKESSSSIELNSLVMLGITQLRSEGVNIEILIPSS
ncbi:hypothetical protein BDZ94DRAFT_1248373 [Collybia nuda]|uniref:Uncharacterized protein n=1 Tax=Collybia nuda TaxID=64659 RepID=A0A9P5YGQ0_9AGAR|nr:hypothetical protein BDZ94DRAFT_1248373 [Collybia nuda]